MQSHSIQPCHYGVGLGTQLVYCCVKIQIMQYEMSSLLPVDSTPGTEQSSPQKSRQFRFRQGKLWKVHMQHGALDLHHIHHADRGKLRGSAGER